MKKIMVYRFFLGKKMEWASDIFLNIIFGKKKIKMVKNFGENEKNKKIYGKISDISAFCLMCFLQHC